MKNLIEILEKKISNPENGLPDELFYFVGRLTPFINVDLLIKHPDRGILLSWRDDSYCGQGWHIPGGIIRFREKIESRIQSVVKNELRFSIKSFHGPIDINQIITRDQLDRSHFISMLYQCDAEISQLNRVEEDNQIKEGSLRFFKEYPNDMLVLHEIYRKYFIS